MKRAKTTTMSWTTPSVKRLRTTGVSSSSSCQSPAGAEALNTSTRNLLAAQAAAGVGHHVALSVVGTERLEQFQMDEFFRSVLAM